MARIERPSRSPTAKAVSDKATPTHISESQRKTTAQRAASTGTAVGQPSSFATAALPALQRVRQALLDKPGDDRAVLRALMEPTLAAALGREATADPAFFGLVDAVVDTLLASPDAMRLLAQARVEIERPPA